MANPAHPVGVTTNGIGRKTTAHLNLTRAGRCLVQSQARGTQGAAHRAAAAATLCRP